MQHCLQMAKDSYQQEKERSKRISDKADYLIKYITILSGILTLCIKIFENSLETLNEQKYYNYVMVIMVVLFVITIALLLSVMRPVKVILLPTGTMYLKAIQNDNSNFNEMWKYIYYETVQYSKATARLEKINKINVILIMIAYISFLCIVAAAALLIIPGLL